MEYPRVAKLQCPRCNGCGYLEVSTEVLQKDYRPWLRNHTATLRNKLRLLKKEGKLDKLSLRQTAKLLGIKSPQQVKHHLLMLGKIGWNNFE